MYAYPTSNQESYSALALIKSAVGKKKCSHGFLCVSIATMYVVQHESSSPEPCSSSSAQHHVSVAGLHHCSLHLLNVRGQNIGHYYSTIIFGRHLFVFLISSLVLLFIVISYVPGPSTPGHSPPTSCTPGESLY